MEWRRGINEEGVIDRPRWSFDVLVTARYVFVWISPAKLRAKHWNIPVSSGSSPFICRLPPTRTLYRGVFTGLMGTASLYHTISGWGTPAGGSEEECYLTHPHTQRTHRTHKDSPRAWHGMSTTFSISAVMCLSGSFTNWGCSAQSSVESLNQRRF